MTALTEDGRRPPPSGGFELFAWWFMRASGLALLLLALGHLAIMHLINSVDTIDYAFVAARYLTPFWRVYDGTLLILAILHGFNGWRIVVGDYFTGLKRVFVHSLSGFVFLVALLLGLYVIFTFQPQLPPPAP
jgi:succinate dehydrogenase / fumarate reductase membrane anchor subunit